jgi:para-aminobenzoate synthetase / 4-amino-4-deoxychorismate lyase
MGVDAVSAGSGGDIPVFALLDDCSTEASAAAGHDGGSRLYTRFVREHVCSDPAQLDAMLADVERDQRAGLHALVLADYEWGVRLQRARRREMSPVARAGSADAEWGGAGRPAPAVTERASLRILLFRDLSFLSPSAVSDWLQREDQDQLEPSVAGVAGVQSSVTREAFDQAIARVHEALRDGESYQINYTYRLTFDMFGPPLALYRRLRARQPVAFGALVALPDGRWVVSLSPELFVAHRDGRIVARPMKGTAARADDPELDVARAQFLATDPKNRAENVMIVDLLRNDLGRIAQTGTVHTPALFAVEPYASVWQMTSTVQARLRDDVCFAEVLRALYPCGSITGAPKIRTMELIDSIETTPRGLYTGTIGWLDAPPDGDRAVGDFCLSVAIRTLMLEAPGEPGHTTVARPPGSPMCVDASSRAPRRGVMGVGAGIVLDSVAADEYDECALKAKFLTGADPGFALFETMFATREGVRHVDRHLARLTGSARYFGFEFNAQSTHARLAAQCAQLDENVGYRMRIALSRSGALELTCAPLTPIAGERVAVLLAEEHGLPPVDASDLLLAHKTTCRALYDSAWRAAEARGAFDMLFFNDRGELAEGGRSSVFVRIAGQWVTPPLSAGVLPGVMRAVLLADPAWQAIERTVTRAEFERRDGLVLCNALRGAIPADVVHR